jgi:hypothetical protein
LFLGKRKRKEEEDAAQNSIPSNHASSHPVAQACVCRHFHDEIEDHDEVEDHGLYNSLGKGAGIAEESSPLPCEDESKYSEDGLGLRVEHISAEECAFLYEASHHFGVHSSA